MQGFISLSLVIFLRKKYTTSQNDIYLV